MTPEVRTPNSAHSCKMLSVQSAVKRHTNFEAYNNATTSTSAETTPRPRSCNQNTAMFCRDSGVAQSIQTRGVGQIGTVIRAVVSTHVNVRSRRTKVVLNAVGGRRGRRTV
jgi:hypothetical protein